MLGLLREEILGAYYLINNVEALTDRLLSDLRLLLIEPLRLGFGVCANGYMPECSLLAEPSLTVGTLHRRVLGLSVHNI